MATNFPTALDTLTNPTGTDTVATVDHAAQHANANDAIEALEAKLGIGASTSLSGYVLYGTGTGSSGWSQLSTLAVTSLAGTTNQVTASASTGSITLSLPQNVDTSATPQFARLGLGIAANASYRLTIGDGTNTTSANAIYFGDSNAIMYRSAASTTRTDGHFYVAKGLTINSSYAAPLDGDLSLARNGGASGYIYLGNTGFRFIGYDGASRFYIGNYFTVKDDGNAIITVTNTSTSATLATIRTLSNTILENTSASGQTYLTTSFNGVVKSYWRFDYAGNINYATAVSGAQHNFYTFASAAEDTLSLQVWATGVNVGQYSNPPGGQLAVYNQLASRVGLYVKGFTSQSANLVTVDNISAVTMFSVSAAGVTTSAGAVVPSASDGAALGSTSLMWSDLFVASGAVLNFNNGNYTLTHSTGALAASGIFTVGAAFREKVVTVSDGAGAVIDASLGNIFDWTAAADRTAGTTTNPVNGQKIIIRFTASGGARTLTLPTATTGDFIYGTDITALTATTSGKTDYIGCVYNGTRWAVVAYTKGF